MRGGSSSFCPFARPWETTCSYPTPALADSTLQAAALRALRNRTVLFYGDSLDGQMFVAVACMLRHHAGHADFHAQWWPNGTDGVVKKRCSDADHCHYSEACVTFAPQQARLCMCLKGLTSCSQKLKNLRPAFRPSIDLLLEGTRAVHEMSRVPWYNDALDPVQTAQVAEKEVADALSKWRKLGIPPAGVLWREATAQHFAEQGGHFRPPDANGDLVSLGKAFANTNIPSQVRCAPHTSQEMEAHAHWNRAANPRLAAAGVTILPVWSSTALAWDAHIDAGDCTHYCQPGIPGIWAGLLIQAVARQSRPLS